MLPADAADPQPVDLVAAQAGEQPRQRDRPDQLHRVVGVGAAGQVASIEVQPGPQELGPYLVGDHPRVGADQRGDAARQRERAAGVEPAREPFPFLAVAEEHPGGHQDMRFGARGDRLPGAGLDVVTALDVVTDRHPVDSGDPGGAGLPGPLCRLGDLRVFGCQPPAGLRHDRADNRPHPRRQRRGRLPAFHPRSPLRAGAVDAGGVVPAGAHGRVAMPERCGRPLQRIEHFAVTAGASRVHAQGCERLARQVFQPRAAVDQQCLAEGSAQPVPGGQRAPVAPLAEDLGDLPARLLDHVTAEYQAGQMQPVEAAQVLEAGEPAKRVSQAATNGRAEASAGSGCAARKSAVPEPHARPSPRASRPSTTARCSRIPAG